MTEVLGKTLLIVLSLALLGALATALQGFFNTNPTPPQVWVEAVLVGDKLVVKARNLGSQQVELVKIVVPGASLQVISPGYSIIIYPSHTGSMTVNLTQPPSSGFVFVGFRLESGVEWFVKTPLR